MICWDFVTQQLPYRLLAEQNGEEVQSEANNGTSRLLDLYEYDTLEGHN